MSNNDVEKSTIQIGGDDHSIGVVTPAGNVAQRGMTPVGTNPLGGETNETGGSIGIQVIAPGIEVTAPVAPTMTDPVTGRVTSVILGEKPEKFSGTDFKRWHQKMSFYLSTCGLGKYLTEVCPVIKAEDPSIVAVVQAWMYGDYLCKNHLLNGLVNSLYGVYCKKPLLRICGKLFKRSTTLCTNRHAIQLQLIISLIKFCCSIDLTYKEYIRQMQHLPC